MDVYTNRFAGTIRVRRVSCRKDHRPDRVDNLFYRIESARTWVCEWISKSHLIRNRSFQRIFPGNQLQTELTVTKSKCTKTHRKQQAPVHLETVNWSLLFSVRFRAFTLGCCEFVSLWTGPISMHIDAHRCTEQYSTKQFWFISWPTFVLLSPALCLECDNGSKLTADSLSVVSYAPVHSVRQAQA